MLASATDARPAHLRRVRAALCSLSEPDQRRLGVIAQWKEGPHELTYRQVERTFGLVARALAKDEPDGEPSRALAEALDGLLEASVTECGEPPASSYAVDWTDLEAFSCPPPKGGGQCADAEAAWGRRHGRGPGERSQTFFGYYLQVVTCVGEEGGPQVPELVRRILIASCSVDPPGALVAVLERMAEAGIAIGDILADCGYAYRSAETWALPLRRLGARLVQDLHPNDRGPKGTHMGAVLANGNLYCPATPKALLELGPLARGVSEAETAPHDRKAEELHRHKLSPLTARDRDGYHRVACPAAAGKLRCPLRPGSMSLDRTRPEVAQPPEHPPACCSQQAITVPASVNAKTAQKHDYPSPAHRGSTRGARPPSAPTPRSRTRPPTTSGRGWCRLMGLTAISLFAAGAMIARNVLIADAPHGWPRMSGGRKPGWRRSGAAAAGGPPTI